MILFKTMHKDYVDCWQDYRATRSVKEGARWNQAGTPVLYLSSNVQNAMLELSNYTQSAAMANLLFRVLVFQCDELRLHTVQPAELPTDWQLATYPLSTQQLGSSYLNQATKFDGILVPSATINCAVATHPVNAVRQSVYSNVVLNPQTVGIGNMKRLDVLAPVYSARMFQS